MMNKSIHLVAKDIRVVPSYSVLVAKDASGGLPYKYWAVLGKG